MNGPSRFPRGFHLLDIAALVVGYSLASVLARAFWPAIDEPTFVPLLVLGIAFVWLGLAMSGPIVLMGHRRRARGADEPTHAEPRTWAELAWLIIGFYWIVLTVLVVPARLHDTRVMDSAFLGVFPVLAALALRVFRPSLPPRREPERPTGWTHQAAVGLLVTWPFAWAALILLGTTLP